MNRKSKPNNNWFKLLKQVEKSKEDFKEYKVKPLRFKTYYDVTFHGIEWEFALRRIQRTWKKHRKTQWK